MIYIERTKYWSLQTHLLILVWFISGEIGGIFSLFLCCLMEKLLSAFVFLCNVNFSFIWLQFLACCLPFLLWCIFGRLIFLPMINVMWYCVNVWLDTHCFVILFNPLFLFLFNSSFLSFQWLLPIFDWFLLVFILFNWLFSILWYFSFDWLISVL